MAKLNFCINCVEYLELLLKITSDFSPFRVTDSSSWLLESAHWNRLAQFLSDRREEWHDEKWYSQRQRSMNGRTANPENLLLNHRMSYLAMMLKGCGTEEFAEFTVKLNCADAAMDIVSSLNDLGDHTIQFGSRTSLVRQIRDLSLNVKETFADIADPLYKKYTNLVSVLDNETYQHSFVKNRLWDNLTEVLIIGYGYFPEKGGASAKNISNGDILKRFGVLSCAADEMNRSPYIKSEDVQRAAELRKRLGGLWPEIGEAKQVTNPKVIEVKELLARIIEKDAQLIAGTVNTEDVLQTLEALQTIATNTNSHVVGEDPQKAVAHGAVDESSGLVDENSD